MEKFSMTVHFNHNGRPRYDSLNSCTKYATNMNKVDPNIDIPEGGLVVWRRHQDDNGVTTESFVTYPDVRLYRVEYTSKDVATDAGDE